MLCWAAVVAMVLSALLGPWLADAAAFRWVHIGLATMAVGAALVGRLDLAAGLSSRAWAAFLVASLFWVQATVLTRWAGFAINGVDFSIFDWMLESTVRGRPGYSPIYEVNHLSVHSSVLLLILTPLYYLFHSPMWLLVLGPTLIWLGLFPLRRLVCWAAQKRQVPGVLQLAVSVAWIGGAYLGRLVNDGFRIESGLPLFSLWFLVGWVERRTWVLLVSALALLLTKEDSALWMIAFGGVAGILERGRLRLGLLITGVSLLFLGAYLGVVQPHFGKPTWGGFWGQFGPTPMSAVLGMVGRPLDVVVRVATSGVWGLLLPMLFLPLLSPRSVAGLAPGVFVLSTASYETMHAFGSYYPAPLVPLALFGLLDVASKGRASFKMVLLALTLFPLFHDGYVRAVAVDAERWRSIQAIRKMVEGSGHVCGQQVLLPHLGYPREIAPLLESRCGDDPRTTVVVNPQLNPWPLDRKMLDSLVDAAEGRRRVLRFSGGFVVILPEGMER